MRKLLCCPAKGRIILKMRIKGAPDDFPPTFLKALGPRTRQELLGIFNFSFSIENLAQIWKVAIIGKITRMHILIQTSQSNILRGKNAGVNPPQQTLYLAETRNLLCTEQAGFRKS